jgi:phosphohistidine phosphatase SixA
MLFSRDANPAKHVSTSLWRGLSSLTRFALFSCSIFILFLTCVSSPVFAAPDPLHKQLQGSQHVLMMRHADAPGYSDPAGFDVKDCSTQRNLGDAGKKQAREIGEWLRARGIKEARVLSSPWCRCMDTAALLHIGPVHSENSLSSFFENRGDSRNQTVELQKKIQKELITKSNKPLIMVTHQVNIQAFTGEGVGSGQMVLVQVNSKGQYVSHRLIKID